MNLNEEMAYEADSEYVHVSELEYIDRAKDFLKDVVEGLYGDKSLAQVERSLEEVCSYLKVPFPNRELTITKKNPYFHFGLDLSRIQTEMLCRTTGEAT